MGTTWGPNASWLTRHPGLPVPWESLSPPHSLTDDGFYFVHSLHSTIFIPVCSNEINKLFWQPHLLRRTIRKKKKNTKKKPASGPCVSIFFFLFWLFAQRWSEPSQPDRKYWLICGCSEYSCDNVGEKVQGYHSIPVLICYMYSSYTRGLQLQS